MFLYEPQKYIRASVPIRSFLQIGNVRLFKPGHQHPVSFTEQFQGGFIQENNKIVLKNSKK